MAKKLRNHYATSPRSKPKAKPRATAKSRAQAKPKAAVARSPVAHPVPRSVASAASSPPAPKIVGSAWDSTLPEDERGVRFFDKHRLWLIFHEDGGKTILTKAKLEKLFYEDHEDRKRHFEEEIHKADSPAAKRAVRRDRDNEKLARRQHITRAVVTLQESGVPIDDMDERGRRVSREDRPQKQKDSKFAERGWRYNPSGVWARRLDEIGRAHV